LSLPLATPTPKKKSGCLGRGCIVAVLFLAVVCGWVGWRITLPGRLAASTHERIRPGARLRDVIAVAEQYWDVMGSHCSEGIESFQVFTPSRTASGSVMIRREGAKAYDDRESVRFGSRPELIQIFDERPGLGSCRRLAFTFLVTGVPPRSSFAVEFGEDGRVFKITPPHSWD
jgi:hypothetical protein